MNNICIFFPPFSGGRFISNCLALSKNVLVTDGQLALEDLHYTGNDYYQFKLNSVLQSFPHDLINGAKWFEFPQLHDSIYHDIIYEEAVQKNKIICRFAHIVKGQEQQFDIKHSIEYHKTMYGNIPVIKLINFVKFNSLAVNLKLRSQDNSSHINALHDWEDRVEEQGDITVNIDGIMFNRNIFLTEIKKLYNFFALDDFNEELLLMFRKKYLEAHGIES